MSISDYFMGIGLKRNINHFANMVKIAKSDNVISPEEIELLVKIS
ncbi:MAG: TerB family tellurite resistance protein [Flavobacteriaceae bacterium]|nr:TerB family tellurite resistance protein [Flavobacteriaceae bacterium]